jgi:hypothetical protein
MNDKRRKRLTELREQIAALAVDPQAVCDEEQEAFDGMPQGFQDGPKARRWQQWCR